MLHIYTFWYLAQGSSTISGLLELGIGSLVLGMSVTWRQAPKHGASGRGEG